jgi:hypothetical protein
MLRMIGYFKKLKEFQDMNLMIHVYLEEFQDMNVPSSVKIYPLMYLKCLVLDI